MRTNILDKNLAKILSFFLISPGSKYNRKDIKEKTKMNNIPLDNALQRLLALKLINKNKQFYFLNFNIEENKNIFSTISDEYKYFNISYQVFNILIDISDTLSKIKEIKSVILFGSFAKLIHTENSDIDLAIILENKIKNRQRAEKKIKDKIIKIVKKNRKEIELHFFMQKDLQIGKSDPLIKDIIKNGKEIL